jgi:hypothetical protein
MNVLFSIITSPAEPNVMNPIYAYLLTPHIVLFAKSKLEIESPRLRAKQFYEFARYINPCNMV